MGNDLNKTVYGGAKIDKATKLELERQPAAEFLNFIDLENDEFAIRMKLPEFGISGKNERTKNPGREVHIRRNMNYLVKAMSKGILTDGKIDLSKLESWISQTAVDSVIDRVKLNQLVEMAEIPPENIDEFRFFMENESYAVMQYIRGFEAEITNLGEYYKAAEDVAKIKDPVERAAQERVLLASYNEVERITGGIIKAAGMDAEKEKEMLFTPDCGSFANTNATLMKLVDAYRVEHKEKPLNGNAHNLEFEKSSSTGVKEVPQGTPEKAFTFHAVFALPAKIGGEDKVISIEATAPPVGKLFFHPEEGRTGTGIFESADGIRTYHESKNTIVVSDRKAYCNIKTITGYVLEEGKPQLLEMPTHMKRLHLAKAQTSKNTLDELIAKSNSSEIDKRMISSSKQFKNMKQALAGIKGLQGTEKAAALAAARKAALEYTRYKLNEGASAAPSDYEKARIGFGLEVLEHVSAELNQMAGGDIERNPITLESGQKVFLADSGAGLIPAETVRDAYMKNLLGMLTEINGLNMESEGTSKLSKELGQAAAKLTEIDEADLNLDKIKELTEGLEKAANTFMGSVEPGNLSQEQKSAVEICVRVKQLNQMAANGIKQPDKQYKDLLAGKLLGNIVSAALADNKPHMAAYCKKIMAESDVFDSVMGKTKVDKTLEGMFKKASPAQAEKMLEMPSEQFMKGYNKLQAGAGPEEALLKAAEPEAVSGSAMRTV